MRAKFRNDTYQRDDYRCRVCGQQATPETAETLLDAHHITPRQQMPGGGYVAENGISLCKGDDGNSCHEKAEAWLQGTKLDGFSPGELYRLIGSSHAEAHKVSLELESSAW